MSKLEKVIFDTNFLLNKRGTSFFAKLDQLELFLEHVDIVIPDMVVRELEEKYKRDFLSKSENFLKTIVSNFLTHNASDFNIEQKILELREQNTISYEEIYLSDPEALDKIKELALTKKPPFEAADGTDKGFKDAYIYFTILQYIEENPQNKIYVCTTDSLLKDSFRENSEIYIIDNFDSFKNNSIAGYRDEYFVELLQKEVDENIQRDSIKKFSKNINDNDIVLIELEDGDIIIEVENRNVIGYLPVNYIHDDINNLINSRNFSTTHSTIATLFKYKHYLSIDVIKSILNAVISNEQIYWILSDEDVREFVVSIYEPTKELMGEDLSSEIEQKIKDA